MKKVESEKYMEKIRINAKTIPVFEEFLPKVNNGFKHIEIQLIHSFLTESEYNDTKKAIDELNVDISVVHTPLIKGNKINGDIAAKDAGKVGGNMVKKMIQQAESQLSNR